MRLDSFLAEHGLVPSREKAKELIRGGQVYVDGRPVVKPSAKIPEDQGNRVEIRGGMQPFVSRGGLKLRKAVESFRLDLEGLTCMDVGASTGGFTDCMLQNGAKQVFAVDVGTGQLHDTLRRDPRVRSMEQTNMRDVKPEDIGGRVDFISIDVSFISLEKILPAASACLKDDGRMVCLVKPQFEAGRGMVSRKGVVKDPRIRERVIGSVIAFAKSLSLYPAGLTYSPIRGQEGNVEYLLHLARSRDEEICLGEKEIRSIVRESGKKTENHGEGS